MAKAKISIDFLLSELRIEKIDDIKKIAIALWEPGGRISVFLDTAFQSLTPNDMKIPKSPFSLPIVIIRDGDIDINALQNINKTKDWFIDILNKTYNAEVLATIDTSYNIQIYFKQN